MNSTSWSEMHRQAPRMSVAAGAVVRKETGVLFVRQTYGWMKGRWGLPTGFVDPGERPDEAALREVREEAGIVSEIQGLLSITFVNWEPDVQLYLVFLCCHVNGEPIPDGAENDRAAYLTLADMNAHVEPFEALSARLARQVLQGQYHLLAPHAAASFGRQYLCHYA